MLLGSKASSIQKSVSGMKFWEKDSSIAIEEVCFFFRQELEVTFFTELQKETNFVLDQTLEASRKPSRS